MRLMRRCHPKNDATEKLGELGRQHLHTFADIPINHSCLAQQKTPNGQTLSRRGVASYRQVADSRCEPQSDETLCLRLVN